ncbi:uncharacterized protein LOC108219410 isoform X2 [Daucus carota subsp. sativus]|uniref:uncharacterized protein LOC108219410 isoform X2 n=1 Tax=Daucus carota subsp. sativus TaxID=79200 RepID=UPI0007EF20E2|nr:PREDICTED: uncharacterized protein LOC108219410 isoform X2 [Daucus carota subsp. sativus]
MSAASEGFSTRSFSELSEDEFMVRVGVDLVAAAKRNLGFLRLVDESSWLHKRPTILEAIRRYDELWMPLISDLMVGISPPMILPPLDIEWVWFCHTLNPASYRQYCEARFSKLIGKAAIFNEENEDYALNRCREIWVQKYPNEPFENEEDSNQEKNIICNEDLLAEVSKQRCLYAKFHEPYMSELVYLIASKRRFKGFLHMMQKFSDGCCRLVPTTDVLLMLMTHQSYPTVYATDVKEMEGIMWKIVGPCDAVKPNEVEMTKKLWEQTFEEPYEKAGCEVISEVHKIKQPIYWKVTDLDVNTKYKSLLPRFISEVCVMVKLNPKTNITAEGTSNEFLRLRMLRCHKELNINQPLSKFTSDSWKKALHLFCEFGTKGLVLELRHPKGRCFRGSSLVDTITFTWNALLRAPSLTLGREISEKVRLFASMTPPVQAPYLLKCVADRVTDDSGAMISDVILKMNQYRPQEGRWLSRTVLDHAGRECFVIRIRVAGGFWRRGGEVPTAVKWEDRIMEIREGSWFYEAGSIGRAPAKVVGSAIPKEPPEGWQAAWCFSTGHELLVKYGSSTSISGLCLDLKTPMPTNSWYREQTSRDTNDSKEYNERNAEQEVDGDDGFVTLVRYSEENPDGIATGLINWKLLLVELHPEEDAAFILLLCISLLRSVTEMKKEDIGGLLIRRRLKEAKLGARDWGSVVLHPSSYSPTISTPYVHPWHWNPKVLMAMDKVDMTGPIGVRFPPEEGGNKLYKDAVIA